MQKPNENPYLVSFSTAAYGDSKYQWDQFFQIRSLFTFLKENFSEEAALYIKNKLAIELTLDLCYIIPEDIRNDLPALNDRDRQRILEIIKWAHEHKDFIDGNHDENYEERFRRENRGL